MWRPVLLAFALLGSWTTSTYAKPRLTERGASHDAVRRFGITVDAGLPDGVHAALVYRPVRPLRFHAGAGHNAISYGVRAGVTLVPLSTWLTPTLSIDVGHYFDGDANRLVRMASGDPTFSSTLLERVGYRYANARVGLELGRERVTFYLHAGISRIRGDLHNLDSAADEGSTMITFEEAPTIDMWSVSARLGLIVYFLE